MSRLAVFGLGLIGGSFALASRKCGLFSEIVGSDRNLANLQTAIEHGICDRELSESDSIDGVCVAVPTQAIADRIRDAVQLVGENVPIIDVGSVKKAVIDRLAPDIPPNYVPCHPIAGSDRSGPEAANADLFQHCRVVLTPLEFTDKSSIEAVSSWWNRLGSDVVTLTPEEHDASLALTSHLPHLLAFAFMKHVESKDAEVLKLRGGGFRDFTRIAGSDPEMWQQIFEDNHSCVEAELESYIEKLRELTRLCTTNPGSAIFELARISNVRRRLDAE